MPSWSSQRWRRDSNQMASEEPGAIQDRLLDPGARIRRSGTAHLRSTQTGGFWNHHRNRCQADLEIENWCRFSQLSNPRGLPKLAHEALQIEDKIGTMLPCNVVVQEINHNQTEIAAIDPVVSMQAIDNPQLKQAAQRVQVLLQKVIEAL